MLKDWRGTEIAVGSTILYITRAGSYMGLTEAVVLEMIEAKDTWSNRMVPALRVRPQRSIGRQHAKKDGVLRALELVTVVPFGIRE